MNPLVPKLREFLAAHSTLTLATADKAGQPMAANVFFVADEVLNLYWVSGVKSRHSRNLQADPRAAVAVHAATWTWTEIQGVQLEGEVRPLARAAEREQAWRLYLAKFPFAQDFEAEVSRSTFYCFTPRWARWIDNQQGFGHQEEVTFP